MFSGSARGSNQSVVGVLGSHRRFSKVYSFRDSLSRQCLDQAPTTRRTRVRAGGGWGVML
jgi:hypothetical protein